MCILHKLRFLGHCAFFAFIFVIAALSIIACTFKPSETISYASIKNSYSQKVDRTPPRVVIIEPKIMSTRGIQVAKTGQKITIKGVVIDDNKVDSLTINAQTISFDREGNFYYSTEAVKGTNKFNLVAIDNNKNQTRKLFEIFAEDPKYPDLQQPKSKPLFRSLRKPTLWILSVGVSKYKNSGINLEYADNDAIAITKLFEGLKGGVIFSEVISKTLVNSNATRAKILTAMANHLGLAGPDDVVIIFVAGHGVKNIQTGSYYFLPHNADSQNLLFEGLKWSDFDEAVKIISNNVKKVVLILDTCHSGAITVASRNLGAGEDLAATMNAASGLYVLSASKGGETSIENRNYRLPGEKKGHGAFTYVLLKGMQGDANYDKNEYLTINEIFSYVAAQVPRITKGKQHPYSKIEGTDLPIVSFNNVSVK